MSTEMDTERKYLQIATEINTVQDTSTDSYSMGVSENTGNYGDEFRSGLIYRQLQQRMQVRLQDNLYSMLTGEQ